MASLSYRVAIKSSARKELERLPDTLIARIVERLEALASNPRPPGCKKLKGGDLEWRIRVGDYRIVYAISEQEAPGGHNPHSSPQ